MGKITEVLIGGIIEESRGYVALDDADFLFLKDYLQISTERLKKRLPTVRSSHTKYLMNLAIDNQDKKNEIALEIIARPAMWFD